MIGNNIQTKTIIEAEMLIKTQNKNRAIEKEFNKLRPNKLRYFLFIVAIFSILGLANYLLDVSEEDMEVYIYLALAISVVSGMIFNESQKINKRIDLLVKLVTINHTSSI